MKKKLPTEAAFFVSGIQQLPIPLYQLFRTTDFNVHRPTDVGTDDGISDSIMFVPTERDKHGSNRY
ncbi:hypothetical protein CDT94_11385 [Cronobacter sakazakii]|nr:hypothetical protein CDT94_11385 [Cronobacter sakazakii]PUY53989.1 hypothetical protein CEA52_13550 [Cronobacter sakazakii]